MNEWNGPNYCVKDGRARAPHTWWTIELFNLSKNFARAALNVKEKKKNSSWFFLKKETTIQIVYARPLVSNNTKFKWGRAPPSTSCRARIPIHGSPLFLPPGALLLTDYSVIPPKCVCIARSKKGGGHLTFMGILECKFLFYFIFYNRGLSISEWKISGENAHTCVTSPQNKKTVRDFEHRSANNKGRRAEYTPSHINESTLFLQQRRRRCQ